MPAVFFFSQALLIPCKRHTLIHSTYLHVQVTYFAVYGRLNPHTVTLRSQLIVSSFHSSPKKNPLTRTNCCCSSSLILSLLMCMRAFCLRVIALINDRHIGLFVTALASRHKSKVCLPTYTLINRQITTLTILNWDIF